jgi:hypothetical protein
MALIGPTIHPHSRGGRVKELQESLAAHGVACTADGDYGPATQRAVEKFQKSIGLKADGVAGPQTIAQLARAPSAPAHAEGATSKGGAGKAGPPAAAPQIRAFSATALAGHDHAQHPTSLQVDEGSKVKLSWKVAQADQVELSGAELGSAPKKLDVGSDGAGSFDVTPAASQHYTLVAVKKSSKARSAPQVLFVATTPKGEVISPHVVFAGPRPVNARFSSLKLKHSDTATLLVDAPGAEGRAVHFKVQRHDGDTWTTIAEPTAVVRDGVATTAVQVDLGPPGAGKRKNRGLRFFATLTG